MSIYWLLLAFVLSLIYSTQRKRLRRQTRELFHQTSRLDQFAEETIRLQRRSDRAADKLARRTDDPPPAS